MRNRTTNQIELCLIRHGATEGNRSHRYVGRSDEPLSQEGRQGLKALAESGFYGEADVVVISPMSRCRQTAELLYPQKKLLEIPEFREMDFGRFEGKNYMDLQGDREYQKWIDSNGTLPFPEGESREQFILRCKRGVALMLEKLKSMDAYNVAEQPVPKVAAVVHGGTIMAVLSSYSEGEYFSYQCGNGEGYRCRVLYETIGCGELIAESIRIKEIRRIS